MSGENPTAHRLVSVLGTGNYQPTRYVLGADGRDGRYAPAALASMLGVREVVVLATPEASNKHEKELCEALEAEGLGPDRVRKVEIPVGRNEAEWWEIFRVMRAEMRTDGASVALDVTHGLRSLPLFGFAVLAFARTVDPSPTPARIYYGAYEVREDGRTPIWDLTLFVDLVDWSRALLLFLRTGRAAEAAEEAGRIDKELRRAWAEKKEGEKPRLEGLAKALGEFGADFETVRTGALLLGAKGRSSARNLFEKIAEAKVDAERFIPPLADVLGRVESMVESLRTESLQGPQGERALAALARLYFEMGRYAEAAAVLREAWITRHASASAATPLADQFDSAARDGAEKCWSESGENAMRTIAQVRNDLNHAAFNGNPMLPETIRARLETLIAELELSAGAGG